MIFKHNNLWKWLSRLGWAAAGVVLTALYLYYLRAQSMPDLQFWHQDAVAHSVVPELKYPAEGNLTDYLEHEKRIFAQLDSFIARANAELPGWHRYSAAAHAIYRAAWPESGRTQMYTPDNVRGAALLVHGLSDSTHSMRPLARTLQLQGYQTLNLRMPGHGTLPGALQNVTWRQFRRAYQLGVETLVEDLGPGQPLILVGYSNGSALAVDYTVDALGSRGDKRVPDLLILVSPAMQVAPVAAYARIQRLISELPGMDKLGWTDIVAEFDPYKYNSFPVYAGEQIYKLTARLQKNLSGLSPGQLQRFPPVLVFQSVLDATIPPTSVVTALLDRLGHSPAELVLFDINRHSDMLPLLSNRGDDLMRLLLDRDALGFDLTIVGTDPAGSEFVTARTQRRGNDEWEEKHTGMRWPRRVFSLSHVALPFDANDPIYGPNKGDGVMRLGELWFKGERGGLGVPLNLLARQRFNPFFPFLEEKVLQTVGQISANQGEVR